MKYACVFCVILCSFIPLVDCRAASRDCHDKFHNCDTWKRSGFCGANSHAFYLRNGCAKTCGFCKSNAPLTTNLHTVQDALHAAHKIGHKAPKGAVTASHKQNAAVPLGALHHQKLHVPPQVPQRLKASDESGEGKPDCRDTYRENPYCEEWKSRGFCDTYKEQLETYCPKTCGFCINAEYVETPTQNATTTVSPSQNSTAKPTPSQNSTAQPTPSQNSTAKPTPPQNSTAQPTPPQNSTAQPTPPQNSTAKPPNPQDSTEAGLDVPVIGGRPTEFADTGNTNSKRGLPLVPEGNSPLWSVNADPRLTLPQPQQYDDMGGAVRRPLEDGTYFTPAKANEKFDYFTEHYSPDPYVAAAQREEWMSSINGVSPTPQLSRKSKKPEVKDGKEDVKVLKKSNVRQDRHTHKNH
ncbi:uncharacterized protein LOC144664293 isoform X2 [Oculina patagonica]